MPPRGPVRKHGVPCPSCGARKSIVSNSRERGALVHRYRTCSSCGKTYPTVEMSIDAARNTAG